MSFLILSCAGKSSTILKYSPCKANKKWFVTMFRKWRQSAGNQKYKEKAFTFSSKSTLGSSETLCKNFLTKESGTIVKTISVHVPTHKKPLTDSEFGYYLAGLIEGDGCFQKGQIIIVFNELDASLAYYIKSRIGYGHVHKIKNKRAIKYVISNLNGLIKVVELINGKLRTEKLSSFHKNLIDYVNQKTQQASPYLPKDDFSNDNFWLAGFSDADASFQIKIIRKADRNYEVRLNYQLDQKKSDILAKLKQTFGGFMGHRKVQDTYYYGSINFGSALKIISYFDKYHLQSSKYVNYLRFRKVYCMIMKKEHLTVPGFQKIQKIKHKMNSQMSKL
jgi:hypothetical protein